MMSEKFDTEFKRKVKGIIPEVPDVVSLRIDATLASLPPIRRNWRRAGVSSAAAALFLLCFIGVRFLYPPAKKDAPIALTQGLPAQGNSADKQQDYGIQSTEQAQGQESAQITVKDAANNKTAKAVASENTAAAARTETPGSKTTATSNDETTQNSASAANQGFTALAAGNMAENQGIQLIMKSVVYDGKAIRIEFDRIAQKTEVAGDNQTTATSGENTTKASTASLPPYAEDYSVKVIVDGIPLKCTINTEGALQDGIRYSGNIIITPDGELPQEFNLLLNIDKIGDVTGTWELLAHVIKN